VSAGLRVTRLARTLPGTGSPKLDAAAHGCKTRLLGQEGRRFFYQVAFPLGEALSLLSDAFDGLALELAGERASGFAPSRPPHEAFTLFSERSPFVGKSNLFGTGTVYSAAENEQNSLALRSKDRADYRSPHQTRPFPTATETLLPNRIH
jgi:hypothetical protein